MRVTIGLPKLEGCAKSSTPKVASALMNRRSGKYWGTSTPQFIDRRYGLARSSRRSGLALALKAVPESMGSARASLSWVVADHDASAERLRRLLALRTAFIARRRSSGRLVRYSVTVVASLCIAAR